MIEITRRSDGITVFGHAGYAEPGKDIVCAGISTLAQTLIQSIEDLTKDNIQYDISPGRVDIKYGNLSERGQLLIDSFFLAANMIANSYPQYVRIDAQALMAIKAMEQKACDCFKKSERV